LRFLQRVGLLSSQLRYGFPNMRKHAVRSKMGLGSVAVMAWLLFPARIAIAQDGSCALPGTLKTVIVTTYSGTKLVSSEDLNKGDRALFQKDHGTRCPGLVKVDFYGDGRPTLALILIVSTGAKKSAKLIVAHEIGEKWETVLLDTAESSVPVAWSQGPGKYEDVYGEKTILATRPVVVFCGYNSWAILYAWTGNKVTKIWLRD
jgi:hypothetical protein